MIKYLQFGVSEENEGYKNQAIITSNLIFVLALLMGFVAIGLSHHFMPELVFLAYIFVIGIILSVVLNFIGLPDVGRFLFVLINALVLSLLNAIPLSPGETVIPYIYLAQASIIVLPWIIIDIREGAFVYIASVIPIAFFIFQSFIIDVFTMEVNRQFLESVVMEYFLYGFSLVNIIGSMYVQSFRNAKNESGGQKMLEEINEKSKKMEEQQKEIQNKIAEMNTSHKVEEDRSWVSKNLTQIAEILRNTKGEDLYPELARQFVQSLKANQAGIYLLNEDDRDPYLEIKGCFAIDRVKHIEQKFSTEEGLLGQCFKDKDFIYINNLPKEHLKFTSGLGNAPPKYMAFIPLIENNTISGIIEIASHQPFEEREKTFFRQVSESIASYVLSNTINDKIKLLIEQNQVQAEEMKSQEEEMLQNMEELQATQEEMTRKEKEYQSEIKRLEAELETKK